MSGKGKPGGFSSVELFVLTSVFGLLLLVAIPSYRDKQTNARAGELAEDLRSYGCALWDYHATTGSWPADSQPGAIPEGMGDRLAGFSEPSPIGGQWDWEGPKACCSASICIDGVECSIRVIQRLDEIMDDGNLSMGLMRYEARRLIMVLDR
ncbi:MAG: type IV pilin protein [Puniceicoccaceae bacterium]